MCLSCGAVFGGPDEQDSLTIKAETKALLWKHFADTPECHTWIAKLAGLNIDKET